MATLDFFKKLCYNIYIRKKKGGIINMLVFYYFFKGIEDPYVTDKFLGEIGDVIYDTNSNRYLEIVDYAEEWIDE